MRKASSTLSARRLVAAGFATGGLTKAAIIFGFGAAAAFAAFAGGGGGGARRVLTDVVDDALVVEVRVDADDRAGFFDDERDVDAVDDVEDDERDDGCFMTRAVFADFSDALGVRAERRGVWPADRTLRGGGDGLTSAGARVLLAAAIGVASLLARFAAFCSR